MYSQLIKSRAAAESIGDVTSVLRCFHRLEMDFRPTLTNENRE
jgi:hypothetical protein